MEVGSSSLPGTTLRLEAIAKRPKSRQGLLKGGLAQLARALALHARGQRFESVILHTGPTQLGTRIGVEF